MVDACVLEIASSQDVVAQPCHQPESTHYEGDRFHDLPRTVPENSIAEAEELRRSNREAAQERYSCCFVRLPLKLLKEVFLVFQLFFCVVNLFSRFLVYFSIVMVVRKGFNCLFKVF